MISNINDITNIAINKGGVFSLLILKDQRIASCSGDRAIRIFNSKTFKMEIEIIEHSNQINFIAQLKNENLISCSSDETIKIYKLFDNNSYKVEQTLNEHKLYVNKVIELNNNCLASSSYDRTIIIWEKNENENYINKWIIDEGYYVDNILEINEHIFVYNNWNKELIFFDYVNCKEIKIIKNVHCSHYNQSFLKLNENVLLVGGLDFIYIIDLINYSILKQVNILDRAYCLNNLKENIIVVSEGTNLKFYKYVNEDLILVYEKKNIHNQNIIYIIKINERTIMTASYDSLIKIINLA